MSDRATVGTDGHGARPGTMTLTLAAVALLVVGGVAGYLVGRSGSGTTTAGDAPAESTQTTDADAPDNASDTAPDGSDAPVTDAAPTEPAPAGSAIETITTPPAETLAMIDPSRLDPDARFSVTFSPFGYGPPQAGGATLVVRISEAILETEEATAMDFTDRNLLAIVDPAEAPLTEGGTYTATLTFQEQGGLLLPVLGGIAMAE